MTDNLPTFRWIQVVYAYVSLPVSLTLLGTYKLLIVISISI
jgi:hypothetical protein